MKHKFSLIWRVAVALVLVLSFSLVAAVPVSAADGSGTCTVATAPDPVVAFSTGNVLTFTFTAAETMDGGAITIDVPSDWSAPQGSSGTAGYTTATSTGTIGTLTFAAQTVTVPITNLANTETITVVYGDGGGASGATAQEACGTATFVTKSKLSGGTLTEIAASPTVDVCHTAIEIVDGEDNTLATIVDGASFYIHVTNAHADTHPAAPDTLDVPLNIYDGVALDTSGAPISTATYTATETGKTTDEFWTDAISTANLAVLPGYKLESCAASAFIRAQISFDKSYYDLNETMTITLKDDQWNVFATTAETVADIGTCIINGSDISESWKETGKDTGVFTKSLKPSAHFDVGDTMTVVYTNGSSSPSGEATATAAVLMYSESSVAFNQGTYAVTATSATVTVTDADKDAAGAIIGTNCLVVENLTTGDSVSFDSLSEGSTAGQFPAAVTFGTGTGELPINDGDQLKATYTDPVTPEDVSTATANIGTPVSLYDAAGDLVKSYTTIAAALAVDGVDYTIEVGPGTYAPSSALTIDKEGLTLKSTDGAAVTIIDATNAGTIAITVTVDDVTVDGFTIDNAVRGVQLQASCKDGTVKNCIFTDGSSIAVNLGSGTTGATVTDNIMDGCHCGVYFDSSDENTVSDNVITGSTGSTEGAICFYGLSDDNTITRNTIIGNEGSGIFFFDSLVCDGNLISGNTISANEVHGINIATTTAPTDLTITGNDITDNEGVGILVESWTAASDAIKFNNITGNDTTNGYGLQNSSGTVDATHNWWGATSSTDIAAMINDVTSSDVTSYDPWVDASVSAAKVELASATLDALTEVGVTVSGATPSGVGTADIIGAALYTDNPKATPTFTPLENGFFDVYVEDIAAWATTDEVILKFYAANENSVVYAWNELGMWEECTLQDFVSYGGGYIWVKVHSELNTTEPTTPTIEGLQYLPFAISTEEVTLESISALPESVILDDVGDTQAITVTATYSDASTADVTATSAYVSDDETVATVSTGGLITAVAEGDAIITVSYTEGGITKTDTVSVSVWDPWIYDEDGDGVMEINEVLNAISDYFAEEITITQVLEVIALYF